MSMAFLSAADRPHPPDGSPAGRLDERCAESLGFVRDPGTPLGVPGRAIATGAAARAVGWARFCATRPKDSADTSPPAGADRLVRPAPHRNRQDDAHPPVAERVEPAVGS